MKGTDSFQKFFFYKRKKQQDTEGKRERETESCNAGYNKVLDVEKEWLG